MKMRKFISTLCAAALLVTALPAASAVSAEPLSEYAGQTIAVQAVEQTENGVASRIVEVAIPEGATETEARTLIYATAFEWDMVSAQSGDFAVTDLGTIRNFSLYDEKKIWSRTLPCELNEIYFDFALTNFPTDGMIQVKLTNDKFSYPSGWVAAETLDIPGTVIREAVFKVSAIPMNEGNTITAYAKCNVSASVKYCNVTGYYRY